MRYLSDIIRITITITTIVIMITLIIKVIIITITMTLMIITVIICRHACGMRPVGVVALIAIADYCDDNQRVAYHHMYIAPSPKRPK